MSDEELLEQAYKIFDLATDDNVKVDKVQALATVSIAASLLVIARNSTITDKAKPINRIDVKPEHEPETHLGDINF